MSGSSSTPSWPGGVALGVQLSGLVPTYARSLGDVPALAQELESLGVHDIVYGEHLAYLPSMHHPSGRQLGRIGRSSVIGDALLLFAAIAASTRRLRVCTSVILAALHEPVLLAKQAATLDQISAGRFMLGVGSGWSADEYLALGVPFKERFARMEESVAACRALWRSAPSSFHGKWTNFDDVLSEPAPVSPNGVPIWWGGNATPITARRVARSGDGWIASEAASYDDLARGTELLGVACTEHGRAPEEVGIRATLPALPDRMAAEAAADHILSHAQRFASVGVTHLTVPLAAYCAEPDSGLELLRRITT